MLERSKNQNSNYQIENNLLISTQTKYKYIFRSLTRSRCYCSKRIVLWEQMKIVDKDLKDNCLYYSSIIRDQKVNRISYFQLHKSPLNYFKELLVRFNLSYYDRKQHSVECQSKVIFIPIWFCFCFLFVFFPNCD